MELGLLKSWPVIMRKKKKEKLKQRIRHHMSNSKKFHQ
jgi:hypothetical protein